MADDCSVKTCKLITNIIKRLSMIKSTQVFELSCFEMKLIEYFKKHREIIGFDT